MTNPAKERADAEYAASWEQSPVVESTTEVSGGVPERIRVVTRDGQPVWQLRCPGCDQWADIDDDQLHGRISVDHSAGDDDQGYASSGGCGYHETRDWFTERLNRGI